VSETGDNGCPPVLDHGEIARERKKGRGALVGERNLVFIDSDRGGEGGVWEAV
jgi:hypothetical protein